MMELKIFNSYESLSEAAANLVLQQVQEKPGSVFCFASGDSPKLAYRLLAEKAKTTKTSFDQCTMFGLDEWLGIPPSNTGSCAYFLQQHLVVPLGLKSNQVHLFDAMTPDLSAACDTMNRLVEENGGIDLMLVGVGMNGHVGFNEPGADAAADAHVVDLDATTLTVGQKYFNDVVPATRGITMGLQQVMQSKKLLMMANGTKKAPVISLTLEGAISNQVPASFIRQHAGGIVMIDEQAAGALKNK